MTAARCAECLEYSIQREDGTAVIRHSPTCETGNDYQPQLNETLSMRDIVVPSSLNELRAAATDVVRKYINGSDYDRKWPEAHFILKYENNADSMGHYIEVRGRVRNVDDPGEDATFRVVSISVERDAMRLVAYKRSDKNEDEPDEMSGIDISRTMRPVAHSGGVHEFVFAAFQLQSVSLIHEPSPHVPVRN